MSILRIKAVDVLVDLANLSCEEAIEAEHFVYDRKGDCLRLSLSTSSYTNAIRRVAFLVSRGGTLDFTAPSLETFAKCNPETLLVLANQNSEERKIMQMLHGRVEESMVSKKDAALVCRKCNSHRITSEQKQTRSADEGFTVFFTCLDCGARWKVN